MKKDREDGRDPRTNDRADDPIEARIEAPESAIDIIQSFVNLLQDPLDSRHPGVKCLRTHRLSQHITR
jgi:hypothetical protein